MRFLPEATRGALIGAPRRLLGALDEIAMLVARADDPAAARCEAGETLDGLLAALAP